MTHQPTSVANLLQAEAVGDEGGWLRTQAAKRLTAGAQDGKASATEI